MPEIITCPQCQRSLQLPEELIGQDVKCPSCDEQFVARVGGAPAPPPPPSSYDTTPYPETPPRYDEPPRYDSPPRRRPRDDYDDDFDDRFERRPRRRRRDMAPHRGGTILTLGILSLCLSCCSLIGIILGIVAISMAGNDLSAMHAGRMDPEGEGQTNAGRICGIIGLILSVLFFFLGIFSRVAQVNQRGF